uniref:Uncharacterized protein n=1 Tax=Siphoviridae sp. ctiOl67 TaxID=2825622 RepID=A0A8S5QJP0_9CAUD|nr:MAG TPA: hypothetical protein [Siphoviridae sp. ctiOl67]
MHMFLLNGLIRINLTILLLNTTTVIIMGLFIMSL